MSSIDLAGYIASAKAEGLTVGLAGSLKARHVPSLVAFAPDLLGFRGALCHATATAASLSIRCGLAAIRALIPKSPRILREANLPDLAPHALC